MLQKFYFQLKKKKCLIQRLLMLYKSDLFSFMTNFVTLIALRVKQWVFNNFLILFKCKITRQHFYTLRCGFKNNGFKLFQF